MKGTLIYLEENLQCNDDLYYERDWFPDNEYGGLENWSNGQRYEWKKRKHGYSSKKGRPIEYEYSASLELTVKRYGSAASCCAPLAGVCRNIEMRSDYDYARIQIERLKTFVDKCGDAVAITEIVHTLGIDVQRTHTASRLKFAPEAFRPVDRDEDGLSEYDLRAYDESLGKHERTVALCKRAMEVAHGDTDKAFELAWEWYHAAGGPHTTGPGRSENERAHHIDRCLNFWADKLYTFTTGHATNGPWFTLEDIEETIKKNTGRFSKAEIELVEKTNRRNGKIRARPARTTPSLIAVVQLIMEKDIHTRAEKSKSGLSELRDVPHEAVMKMVKSIRLQHPELAPALSATHQNITAAMQLVTMFPRSPLSLDREYDRKIHRCSSFVLRANYKPGDWLLKHVPEHQLQRQQHQCNTTTYSFRPHIFHPINSALTAMRVFDGGRGDNVKNYTTASFPQTMYNVHTSTQVVETRPRQSAEGAAARSYMCKNGGKPPPDRQTRPVASTEPQNSTDWQLDPLLCYAPN